MAPSTPKDVHTRYCFGYLNDQPIPYKYYNLLNYDDDGSNNITGNPVEDDLPENEGVEDTVTPNDEYINYEIIIDDNYSLDLDIEPPLLEIEEVESETEVREIEWIQKLKEWT